jgi:hypothetical protein
MDFDTESKLVCYGPIWMGNAFGGSKMLVFFTTSEIGLESAEDLFGNQDNIIREAERAKLAKKNRFTKKRAFFR